MMELFKKLFERRPKLMLLTFCAVVLVLSVPTTVHAVEWLNMLGFGLGAVLSVAVTGPILVINFVIAAILGLAVPIISYFIGVMLQLNMNIVSSNIVRSGFTITLALANLGFVLAIIIIAIMTIIRYESYALKQTLWKLVSAAILVNFSLVICATILNFSDNLSFYFLDSINPAGEGSSYTNFASALAGSFNTQRIFLAGKNGAATSTVGNTDAFADVGGSFSSGVIMILNLFFPTIFLAVVVIALGGFFIMLLIRYVYLGILLILMPMAWLLWIFPLTSGQWTKWWSKFIQWTMFAPVVLFFIYLAILTMGGNDTSNIQGVRFESPSENPIVGSISNFTGNILSGLLGPLLQMAMMVSLVFAGLFMASSMGITFADATIKGASWVTSGIGKGVGGFAKRRALIGAGAAMKKSGLQNVAQRLQKFGAGRGVIGRTLSLPTRLAGRGIEATMVATNENLVKDAQTRLSSQTNDQLVHGVPSTFTSPEKIAAMKELGKRGILDAASMDNTHKKETKDLFASYGQKNEYEKEVEKKSGVSSEMYEALKNKEPQGRIDELAVEFAKKFSRAEISAMQAADLFSDVPAGEKKFGLENDDLKKVSSSTAYGLAVAAPQFASTVLSKLKSKSLDNFSNNYRDGLVNAERRKIITTEEYTNRDDAFKRSIANNTMGFVPITETPSVAPASGAPPAGGTPPPTH